MIFRQAKTEEIQLLLRDGYEAWPKNRTFEQYCADNLKEDAYGMRYVLEKKGEIVSSLIVLTLNKIHKQPVCGIGSVLTPKRYEGHGYATELLESCIKHIKHENNLIFLYSEINPAFYSRFNFKALPPHLQKDLPNTCMVLCSEPIWSQLSQVSPDLIPDYF